MHVWSFWEWAIFHCVSLNCKLTLIREGHASGGKKRKSFILEVLLPSIFNLSKYDLTWWEIKYFMRNWCSLIVTLTGENTWNCINFSYFDFAFEINGTWACFSPYTDRVHSLPVPLRRSRRWWSTCRPLVHGKAWPAQNDLRLRSQRNAWGRGVDLHWLTKSPALSVNKILLNETTIFSSAWTTSLECWWDRSF